MRFDDRSIPGRIARSGREDARRVVIRVRAGARHDFAIASSEPRTVFAMLREDLKVEMWAKVKQALEPDSAEGLVTDSRAGQRNASAGQVSRRSYAVHGVCPKALHTQLTRAECLASREERGVGILAVGQVYVTVG